MKHRFSVVTGFRAPYYAYDMTPTELDAQANAWITHRQALAGSPEYKATAWAIDTYEYLYEDPETLWLLILAVHGKDQSPHVQGPLSAGMVEDLLALHGDTFIDRVEAEARRDPLFANLLGGVWKNSMSDEVWERIQCAWDRKGWDRMSE